MTIDCHITMVLISLLAGFGLHPAMAPWRYIKIQYVQNLTNGEINCGKMEAVVAVSKLCG